MKVFSVLITLVFFLSNVYAAQQENSDVTKTKKLYSCYLFYTAASQAPANTKKTETAYMANRFLQEASILAAKSGSDENAKKLLTESGIEYRNFMDNTAQIKDANESNNRIKEFINSCKETLQSLDKPSAFQKKLSEALAAGNYEYAIEELLTPLAEAGDVQAQTNLGAIYLNGPIIYRDFTKAAYWTQKGAAAGNPYAQANLGLMYFYGKGVEQDDTQAMHWLSKAAARGNAGAQSSLGILFLEGRGVTRDYKKAQELFTASMNAGNPSGANNLAKMIESKLVDTPHNLKDAIDLYEIAAQNGDPAAQNRIGLAYLNGEYRDKNRQTAKTWFEKSALQEEKYGMYHYGLLLLEDNPNNVIPGLKWIMISAKQGYIPAQQKLEKVLPTLTSKEQTLLNNLVTMWNLKRIGVLD